MKKKIIIFLIIICLLMLGCSKNNEKEKNTHIEESIEESNKVLKKFYDESRLDFDKMYTLEDSIVNFSFILSYPNDSNTVDMIYSYAQDEKVEFFEKDKHRVDFIYFFSEKDTAIRDLEIVSVSTFAEKLFTKENYKKEFEELNSVGVNFEIVEENGEYAFIRANYEDSEYITYFALKFFDEDSSIFASVTESNSNKNNQARYLEALKGVLNTITLDNGDAILEDKIALIPNYQNKKLVSSLYVSSVKKEGYNLVSYDNIAIGIIGNELSYINDWKKLSNNNPYIFVNSDKIYKIISNGKTYFYEIIACSKNDYDCENMAETVEDFENILNKFYE